MSEFTNRQLLLKAIRKFYCKDKTANSEKGFEVCGAA